jgi:hypothetical protein
MICLSADAAGVLSVINPQPSDVTACSIVVGNYAESANPWIQLTTGDGALIAGAILAVWAVGYSFRVLIKVLKHTDEKETES